ncbi:MAG: LCP family protein [Prevotella sp.]|nr:LCP family protein [Prevotella sp.]
MAKKGTKIALTYFITIIVTLIIIGGICFMLFRYLTEPGEPQETAVPDIERLVSDEYVPSASDSKTTLFIFDSEKRLSGCCFMIVRMIADEQRLVVMPIPADTCAKVNGTEDSLYEFYRRGGAPQAVSAAENAVGVTVDYYMKLNNESFSALVDIFGGVDFDVPYNLIYSNPDTGEETIIREGTSYLDSDTLRKVVTYPLYSSGEEYRAKIAGVLINDLINRNIDESFSNHVDDYFSAVINSTAETNFTAYDYEEQSAAMKYVASSDGRVSQLVTVTGAYNENGLFVLDENFLKSLTERFKLYEPDSGETVTSLMAVE